MRIELRIQSGSRAGQTQSFEKSVIAVGRHPLSDLRFDPNLDIDVSTAEGTHVPRSQRWRQIISQIDILTSKYKELAAMMGVGLYAPEVFDMRRVSRSTGRLVPIFLDREYDETGPPIRKLPPRPSRDEDPDGPLAPYWPGGWGW